MLWFTNDELTIVLREAHAKMSFFDLLCEHVLLVQEEYDGGGGEVAVVADAVEQVQALVHSILKGMFDEDLFNVN